MNTWLQWIILTSITGSPLGSAVVLLVFWFVVDRFTFGVLPDPVRWVMRWRRAGTLERLLLVNSHDGRARLELAQLYVQRGKGRAAVDVLRPNLERGDDDVQTMVTMGEACLQAGFAEQGEKLLERAEELSPEFRVGEVFLIRGKYRLQRGDFASAKEALTRLVSIRKGTVMGRVLLARAQQKLGDDASAALLRDDAWNEFASAPVFQRRQERFWAWRARPSRPLMYLAVILFALFMFAKVVAPKLSELAGHYRDPATDYEE
jgi:tetratricopeptide (TPR) repeat protein